MGTFANTASSITVYCLPTKEKKHLFFVIVCSKQMEVCHFRFPFTENNWKLPFSVSSIFCLQNYGNVETWRFGDGHIGDMETWRNGDIDMKTSNGNRKTKLFFLICLQFAHHANRSLSFVCLLMRNEWKLTICQRTKWIWPSMGLSEN